MSTTVDNAVGDLVDVLREIRDELREHRVAFDKQLVYSQAAKAHGDKILRHWERQDGYQEQLNALWESINEFREDARFVRNFIAHLNISTEPKNDPER